MKKLNDKLITKMSKGTDNKRNPNFPFRLDLLIIGSFIFENVLILNFL